MAKVRLSTTVDADLLEEARGLEDFGTDASVVEAALRALLAQYRNSRIDAAYAAAYERYPAEMTDDWGDLESFLDAAARS